VVETLEQDVPAPTQGEIDRDKREARKAAVAGAARLALGGSKDARIRRNALYLIAFIALGFGATPVAAGALALLALTDHVVDLG
jgi:hypothetical protein